MKAVRTLRLLCCDETLDFEIHDPQITVAADLLTVTLELGEAVALRAWLNLVLPETANPHGVPGWPCEACGNQDQGSTRMNGWLRCNVCGHPAP